MSTDGLWAEICYFLDLFDVAGFDVLDHDLGVQVGRVEIDLATRVGGCPKGIFEGQRMEIVLVGQSFDSRKIDACERESGSERKAKGARKAYHRR